MTSSTKPEVRNVSQRRQRRTEPRPQATCTRKLKIGLAVFELCERTDRQTDILITILRTATGGEVRMEYAMGEKQRHAGNMTSVSHNDSMQ